VDVHENVDIHKRVEYTWEIKKFRKQKMLSHTEKTIPEIIELFPGFEHRSYFQDSETGEFWFHAASVCKVLGFSNLTSALNLYCDDDEKLIEVVKGKASWFVSEAGCYGLAMGAKNDIAKSFKRWLKHTVLPKLRSSGGYIMPTATSEQLEALQAELSTAMNYPDLLR
jgi:anti-repressor protein